MKRFISLFYYRKLRNSRYMQRVGLMLAFIILMTIILPRSFRLQYQYEVGQSWRNPDLIAPFDFPIYKTQDSINQEVLKAESQVVPIFLRDSVMEEKSIRKLEEELNIFYQYLTGYQKALEEQDSATLNRIKGEVFTRRFPIEIALALQRKEKLAPSLSKVKIREYADIIYKRGYLDAQPDTLGDIVALRVRPTEEVLVPVARLVFPSTIFNFTDRNLKFDSEVEKQLYRHLLSVHLAPNYRYSKKLTDEARQIARSLISPVYGKVTRGTLIIRKGELVDKRKGAIIRSLIIEKEKRVGSQTNLSYFISKTLIIFLITMLLLAYLSVNKPRIYFSNVKLSLILFVILLAVGGMALATRLTEFMLRLSDMEYNFNLSFIYLAPSCIVAIFVSNFFGHRVGFVSNLLTALYGAVLVQQSLEFAFVQIMAGSVAVFSLRQIRKREVFFYTLIYIFLAYAISYIAFNMYSQGGLAEINYNNISLFAINVALTIIVYNLIYVIERIFGLTSDLTYLELLDTNHPLLQQMARKAPGTFQHSLQVANIAEATINVIGGNGLLIHVGALYHDIGKLIEPQYFIENQSNGVNPHDELTCAESAQKIIQHVQHGIELAHKYKLPREIIHFIETHHGTTRVEYFYRTHLKQKNCKPPEDEELFRYKGPLPFSKETAVLMIADSIEAASRALKKPTPESLKALVNNIIDHKIKDNQLEKSNLTFNDITTIRKVITRQLLTIYHSRIEYPQEPAKAEEPEANEERMAESD
ncbi:MAG: HDIG domain-containing protein [Bacteroidetes bacterium]|nr:MAG: HDIG domain-containing protein [Bacteroidota bacterium]